MNKSHEFLRSSRRALTSALLITAACFSAPGQATAVRHQDGTMHFYLVVRVATGINWSDANAAAAKAGGYLATVTSTAESTAIASLLTDPANWIQEATSKLWNGPWIGGVQISQASEPDGGWAWAEPEAFGHTSWSSGQPDNDGNADRVHFGGTLTYPVATWGDLPEGTKLPGYVIEFSNATVPTTLGLRQHEKGALAGYTLISPMTSKVTHLVDDRGRVVHSWTSAYTPGQSVYLLTNGNLLRCGSVGYTSPPSGGSGGIVEEFDWNNKLVWSYSLATSTELLHHDIARLPNGNTLMLVWDYKTEKEALDAGRDPALLKDKLLWPDKIIEVKPTGLTTGTVVWQWHPFDHLVQDFDSKKANYGDPAKSPHLIDINYTPDGIGDWMHSNSIDYNAKLDQIVISVRSFDEIWVIDHSTTMAEAAGHTGGKSGKGGDLLYRWGNPMTYRAGALADRRLFRQHDAHWIPDGLPGAGHILLFNNGIGRPQGTYSTADEIVLPTPDTTGNYAMTGSTWGPAAATWSYADATPTSLFSGFVSGAQRLPNGNTLVGAGWLGFAREVDTKGNTRWEYMNPTSGTGPGTQGDLTTAPQRAIFRAPRYAPDHEAFKGKTLTPGEPIEKHSSVLLVEGSTTRCVAKINSTVKFSLRAASLPGQIYLMGTSATTGLIPVDHRFARAGWDAVMETSILGLAPTTFQGYAGILDSNGAAVAKMVIPDIPALHGLEVYTTMFVAHPLAPTGVGMISNTVTVEID